MKQNARVDKACMAGHFCVMLAPSLETFSNNDCLCRELAPADAGQAEAIVRAQTRMLQALSYLRYRRPYFSQITTGVSRRRTCFGEWKDSVSCCVVNRKTP